MTCTYQHKLGQEGFTNCKISNCPSSKPSNDFSCVCTQTSGKHCQHFMQNQLLGNPNKDVQHNCLIVGILVTESWNPLAQKRPLKPSSPTTNLALPSPPLNHVHKCHIYTSLNTYRAGDSTTSPSSLFQYLITHSKGNFSLNIHCHYSSSQHTFHVASKFLRFNIISHTEQRLSDLCKQTKL